MKKGLQAGDRVKYFEPAIWYLDRGTVEKINKDINSMDILEDGFDKKMLVGAEKRNDCWFAFSCYSHEYTLKIFPENKFVPIVWVKTHIRKLRNLYLELSWKLPRLQKQFFNVNR